MAVEYKDETTEFSRLNREANKFGD